MRITGWDIKCSTFHSKSQFLIMTSKDKTRKSCENAALTIFTFSQIHSWMKRAKVFACWKGAFTSYEASRRVSEDETPVFIRFQIYHIYGRLRRPMRGLRLKTILYESLLCMQSFIMVGHKSPELQGGQTTHKRSLLLGCKIT